MTLVLLVTAAVQLTGPSFSLWQKSNKGSAIIDYKTKLGADMALQYEKGLPDRPVVVSELSKKTQSGVPSGAEPSGFPSESKDSIQRLKRDYEALADMEKRRKNERAALIAEMLRNDGVDPES
ncbi:hypothetical protein FHG87_023893 [Trinorchestia longiramus]|nr:hypothetical protein FHG87_023893 [Trinorchestia longiramus]